MGFLSIIKNNKIDELEIYLRTHDANEETQGQSLLYWAVYMNNKEFAELLINKGANTNQKDTHGRTPLTASCFFNFVDITKILLKNKAIITASCMERAYSGWNGSVQ